MAAIIYLSHDEIFSIKGSTCNAEFKTAAVEPNKQTKWQSDKNDTEEHSRINHVRKKRLQSEQRFKLLLSTAASCCAIMTWNNTNFDMK